MQEFEEFDMITFVRRMWREAEVQQQQKAGTDGVANRGAGIMCTSTYIYIPGMQEESSVWPGPLLAHNVAVKLSLRAFNNVAHRYISVPN